MHAERTFPFGKSMMLNVVYDTFDRLGVTVRSSNSEQGLMRFKLGTSSEVVLTVNAGCPQSHTLITLDTGKSDAKGGIAEALLDEIESTITASTARA